MPKALVCYDGPAPKISLCGFCSPQIIIISCNSPWTGICIHPVELLFILQNPAFCIPVLLPVSLNFLIELLTNVLWYVKFLLYIPLFLPRL